MPCLRMNQEPTQREMVGVGICSAGLKMQNAAAHQQAPQHCQFQLLQQEECSLHVQQAVLHHQQLLVLC